MLEHADDLVYGGLGACHRKILIFNNFTFYKWICKCLPHLQVILTW